MGDAAADEPDGVVVGGEQECSVPSPAGHAAVGEYVPEGACAGGAERAHAIAGPGKSQDEGRFQGVIINEFL